MPWPSFAIFTITSPRIRRSTPSEYQTPWYARPSRSTNYPAWDARCRNSTMKTSESYRSIPTASSMKSRPPTSTSWRSSTSGANCRREKFRGDSSTKSGPESHGTTFCAGNTHPAQAHSVLEKAVRVEHVEPSPIIPTLSHTDDLIQALTYLCEQTIGQCPDRMWLGSA